MERRTKKGTRSGQVIVLTPMMLLVIGIIVSLTADVGHLAVTCAKLQNSADATALAAAQVLLARRADGDPEETARTVAVDEALDVHMANYAQAGLTIEFGTRDPDGAFVGAGSGTAATAVRATSYRNHAAPAGPLPLIFASLVGIDSCDVAGAATCEVNASIRGVLGGLSPFAVPQERIPAPGEEFVFYGGSQTVAGNWGLLDLNGGPNSTGELKEWILNGYSEDVVIPLEGFLWIDGTPGFRAAVESAMTQRIGDVLTMIVYDEAVGQGSNADYRCVGFMRGTLLQVDLHGPDPHLTCRVEGIANVHDLVTGGTYESPNMRKVQLIF